MTTPPEGTILWEPSDVAREASTMAAYMRWLEQHGGEHLSHTTRSGSGLSRTWKVSGSRSGSSSV